MAACIHFDIKIQYFGVHHILKFHLVILLIKSNIADHTFLIQPWLSSHKLSDIRLLIEVISNNWWDFKISIIQLIILLRWSCDTWELTIPNISSNI